ncbi:MAG TPA: hypothetical protein VG755_38980 [Nannocystaceae bacterium]|nr:hypothetical protein [Nannocystaceae bacterium]
MTREFLRIALPFLAFCASTLPAIADAAEPAAPTIERTPVVVDFLIGGGIVHEDRDNRMTTRDARAFVTPSAVLRLGGVVGGRHMVSGLLQVDWRSTRTVLDASGNDRKWGAISSYYLGPEYRYLTRFGLYAGGSLGFTYTLVDDDVGGGGSPDCSRWSCVTRHMRRTDDRGIPGVGARAVVGYELRVRRNLAVLFEAFGGVRHGEDEHGRAMTLPTYGLAIGVGL